MDDRKYLHRNERLSLQKDINRLFESGHRFVSFPFQIIYLKNEKDPVNDSGVSVLICVPKKRIRKAVKRNYIKRLIRESFRINKSEISTLYKQKGEQLHIAFIYICNEIKLYNDVEKAILKALNLIQKKILLPHSTH